MNFKLGHIKNGNEHICVLRHCELEPGETDVTIPPEVARIEANAFEGCRNLERVTIPENVRVIAKEAFAGLSRLREVTLCIHVKIHGRPFNGCDGLRRLVVTLPKEEKSDATVPQSFTGEFGNGKGHIEELILPENLAVIKPGAFDGFSSLRTIDIPGGVTSVSGFGGCTSLSEIHLPESLTEIGDDAFRDCTRVTEIDIPKAVARIGNRAWMNCKTLAKLEVPDAVKKMSAGVFDGSGLLGDGYYTKNGKWLWGVPKNVRRFVMPDTVTNVAPDLFAYDKELREIVLSPKLKAIPEGMFQSCSKLKRVVIPGSVKRIDRLGFYACKGLETVEIPRSVKLDQMAFHGNERLHLIWMDGDTRTLDARDYRRETLTIPEDITACEPCRLSSYVRRIEVANPELDIGPLLQRPQKPEKLTVCAKPGSHAERDAGEHGIRFEAL